MALTVDSLVKIVQAGGGLVIDCKVLNLDNLVRIANASKEKGATIILKNTSTLMLDTLVKISEAGAGNIIIDTTG